ncbi:MAG TPA: hypothetical protein VHC72_06685 [Bryobacteraceae bacterium]|nr:hypothetical protein [Bryobacteraceae bacterium]
MDFPPDAGQFPSEIPSPEAPPMDAGAEPRDPTSYAVPPPPPWRPGILVFAFAGLQAGIVGVLWMFLCFFAGAIWTGSGIWSVPNLFSTLFHGEYAYQNEFFRSTWAGIAFIIVIYGGIGALWGLIWRGRRPPLFSFAGAIMGMVIYYLFWGFIWPHADPMIADYAPLREVQLGHILWGLALAKSPAFAGRIAAALTPAPAYQPPNPGGPDSVTGEVIQ